MFSKAPFGTLFALLLPASRFQALEAVAPVGSCISSPEASCTSLMAICIGKVLGGQVVSNKLWSSPECFSAAICTGIGSLLDALCCAGACKRPLDIQSLDYNLIYAPIVGSCAFQSNGCPMTWTPFVNWYYKTIQTTGTNSWPEDGDRVLEWWRQLATWTAFCVGDRCVDGAIPYLNLNDFLHYSGAPIVHTPGTPPSNDPVNIFGDIESDIWKVTASDPCPSDDITDCWYDYGPPSKLLNGKIISDGPTNLTSRDVKSKRASTTPRLGVFGVPSGGQLQLNDVSKDPSILPFVGPNGPRNCPPPIFIQGGAVSVPVNMSGCPDVSRTHEPRRRAPKPEFTYPSNLTLNSRTASLTPNLCEGDVDTATPPPVLTYYCDRLPNICASIRSTDLLTDDEITLHYDPFGDGTRRDEVCTFAVKKAMQLAGKCDKRRHTPANWLVSCDEFPFNSVLEGGAGNAIVKAVSTREQQYQGVIHARLSKLQHDDGNGKTSWSGPSAKMCHTFILRLSDTRSPTAPLKAIGELARGGAFFGGKSATAPSVFITDGRASAAPTPYSVDVAYSSVDTAMKVPNGGTYNCAPQCNNDQVPRAVKGPPMVPTGTSLPLDIRAATASPGCTRTQSQPTSTPAATAAAQVDLSSSAAHAAAPAAALAAAVGLAPDMAAAAAAAVEAANLLAQSAAALITASSSSAMAAAVAAANSAVFQAQSIADIFESFGTNLPASVTDIISEVLGATSGVAAAVEDVSGIVPPQIPVTPPTDPGRDPNVNTGGSSSTPPAACFGPDSQGNVHFAGTAIEGNGVSLATILDVGNPGFFGLHLDANYYLTPVDGCNNVYTWGPRVGPSYQVDCNSKELGSYWNGRKIDCRISPAPSTLDANYYRIICSNSISDLYNCASVAGLDLSKIFPGIFTWEPK